MRKPKSYIDHKLTPPKAFFEWCHSKIPTYRWSNKQQMILASNRENCYVIEKKLTKRTNLSFFAGEYFFSIVLVTAKRIEIQSYRFSSRIDEGHQEIAFELSNLEQFADGQHIKVSPNFYGQAFYGLTANREFMGGPYTGTKFYPNSWEDKVKNISELRYLHFDSLDWEELENIYKYKNEIEFLQKINAKVLAREVMYPQYSYAGSSAIKSVDMRVITSKWLKINKQFFKNSNRSFNEYELERRLKKRNGKIVPGIEKYLNYRDVSKIPEKARMINFQNWIIKNEVNFGYYCDYLMLMEDLGVAVDSDNLITPKDLTAAHDNAVKLFNTMQKEKRMKEDAEKEKKYLERIIKIKELEAEIDGFKFIVPEELSDLIIEGKKLHRCVGGSSYVEGHLTGRTTIVFLRNKEKPKEPFFTLEYKGGRIIQLRGKHNQVAPESVQQAADHWLEWTKTIKVNKKAGSDYELVR